MEVVNEQIDADSTILETTLELDDTADTIETNGNFVNDSIVQATNNSNASKDFRS